MKSFAIAAICMASTVYGWTGCFFDEADKKQGVFFFKESAEKGTMAGAKFGKGTELAAGEYSLDIYEAGADDTSLGAQTA